MRQWRGRKAAGRAVAGGAAALAFFALVAWAFHWKMARFLGTRLDHAGDPVFCAWVLDWAHRCLAGLATDLWSPPIFHPHPLALAASDNLLWPSLLTFPLWLARPDPVLAHNAAYLAGVALSGWSAWWWARRVTGDAWAALLPGVAFAVGPFMLSHGGHLQMHHGYWIPLALLAVREHAAGRRDGSPRRWAALGLGALCLPAQFASNTYYFAMLPPAVGLAQLAEWCGLPRAARARGAAEIAAFWVLAAALTAPLARPYFELAARWAAGRPADEVLLYSAAPANYLGYNRENLWFGRRTAPWAPPEKALAPGLVVAALVLAPAFRWERRRRRHREADGARRAAVATALAIAAFGFLMSLGPAPPLVGRCRVPGLYALFQAFVPGYEGMRVPARFAVLVVLGLSLLAAWNWRAVAARRRSAWSRRLVGALPAALALAEFASAPRHPSHAPRPYAAGAWLAAATEGVAIERFWPMAEDTWKDDLASVFDSMSHGRPLVNGYSGYFPPEYRAMQHYAAGFPGEAAVRVLRDTGADYLVLRRRRGASWPPDVPLPLLAEFPGERIYALGGERPPAPETPAPPPPGPPVEPAAGWRVSAAPPGGRGLGRVIDGDAATVWRSPLAQRAGMSVEVTWPGAMTPAACRLHFGDRANAFPRHFRLLGRAADGGWRPIEYDVDPVEFIRSARASPRDPTMTIRFPEGAPPVGGVRIELTETREHAPFAIAEWEFFEATARPRPGG